MAFEYDPIFAVDPSNTDISAPNSLLVVHLPGDTSLTAVTLTTLTGMSYENPVMTNAQAFAPAFISADQPELVASTLDGAFSVTLHSVRGLRDAAAASANAAELAAGVAASQVTTEFEAQTVRAEDAASAASVSEQAAIDASLLVDAPAGAAVDAAIQEGGAARASLNAAVAESAGLNVRAYGATGDGATDDTAAFQAVANIGGIVAVPAGTYVIDAVSLTKSVDFICKPGTVFKRLPGADGAGESYWNVGSAMFEIDAPALTVSFTDFTHDGNAANQTGTEPTGFFLKTYPTATVSASPTTIHLTRGRFTGGTSGYLLLRGDNNQKRYETRAYLNECVMTDTVYGKGKGDPSTPNALGYLPTYVMVMDYVHLHTRNFRAEWTKPTGTGQYAACAVNGTFFGTDYATSGQSSVFMHGTTHIKGLGRSAKKYDDDTEFTTNNGIGCIDMYGNGDTLFIEHLIGKDTKNVVARAKGSLRNYTVLQANLTNCHRGLQVGPSSTGPCETVAKVGNVHAYGGTIPQVEFTGSSATDRLRSVALDSMHLLGLFTNPENLGTTGVLHVRNTALLSGAGAVVTGAPVMGVTVVDVEHSSLRAVHVDGVTGIGTGIYYGAGVSHSLQGFSVNATAGAGVNFATNPKKATVRDGRITDAVNYGLFANTTTMELSVDAVEVDGVTGQQRGFYTGGGNASFTGNRTVNVETPIMTGAGTRKRETGNSWNAAAHPGTAAPTAGTWSAGDIVYNTAPVAGGSVGWICTTAGTPGTWKTFGAIAA